MVVYHIVVLICQFQFLLDNILVIYISLQKVGSLFYHRKILGELIFAFELNWMIIPEQMFSVINLRMVHSNKVVYLQHILYILVSFE